MTGDMQFLNTCVGATPAAAATHGTAVDAVQPATPQTPTGPAFETLPPMGMGALCFDSSTRSAINYIICRAAEADGCTVSKIVAATLPSEGRGDMPPARRLLQLPDKNADLPPYRARLVRGSAHGRHHNISLPLGIDTNTTAGVVWILFPDGAVYANRGSRGGRPHCRLAGQMHAEVHRAPGPR